MTKLFPSFEIPQKVRNGSLDIFEIPFSSVADLIEVLRKVPPDFKVIVFECENRTIEDATHISLFDKTVEICCGDYESYEGQ